MTGNARLIYESPDGGETVYSREVGQLPSERKLHYESNNKVSLREQIKEKALWHKILLEGKTNPTLQKALEQCIIIYNLSKDNGSKT